MADKDVQSTLRTILKELSSLNEQVQGTNINVRTEVEKLKTANEFQWRFKVTNASLLLT